MENVLESTTLSVENNYIPVDEKRIQAVIEKSLIARERQLLVFSEAFDFPEKQFVELIQKYAEKINDEAFPLNALFMVTSLVFAQDTNSFFGRISDEELLSKHSWIFNPEEIVIRADKGEDVEKACMEYLQPAGYSRNAIKQWVHNSRVLSQQYGGDIRKFFQENDDDAEKIIESLVVRPRAKTREKNGLRRFGPKLARLYIQWVNQYDLYDLKNADKVGLPIDFQLARIFIQTGGLPLEKPEQAHTVAHKILLPLLSRICDENGWEPRLVSETIWRIGSKCCRERLHDICPVANMCNSLISRTPYDRGGRFDPTDVGRFG